MSEISSLYARRMILNAQLGDRAAPLLQQAGVDPSAPPDPKLMITEDTYCTLLETIADMTEGPANFHILTGAAMRCEHLGALGLAWKSAPTLREAIERATRYSQVLVRVSRYGVRDRGEECELFHERDNRRRGALLSNEAALATLLSISREAAGDDVAPIAVRYRHAPMNTAPALRAHFQCPIEFESHCDALVFTPETLARKNRVGDESLYRFFEAHLEKELALIADDAALDRRVRIQVSQSLSGSVPTISDVAMKLGMSGRTLQRRLSDHGFSYQSLVDNARRELAERLLQQTDYALAEIAFLTGFSEQSTFTRAFKRWSGQTPRSYRVQAQTRPG